MPERFGDPPFTQRLNAYQLYLIACATNASHPWSVADVREMFSDPDAAEVTLGEIRMPLDGHRVTFAREHFWTSIQRTETALVSHELGILLPTDITGDDDASSIGVHDDGVTRTCNSWNNTLGDKAACGRF